MQEPKDTKIAIDKPKPNVTNKLIINNTIQDNDAKKIQNFLSRGNEFFRNGDYINANEYYEKVLDIIIDVQDFLLNFNIMK